MHGEMSYPIPTMPSIQGVINSFEDRKKRETLGDSSYPLANRFSHSFTLSRLQLPSQHMTIIIPTHLYHPELLVCTGQ